LNYLQIAGLAYLILINLIGFFTAFSDKRRARLGKWRVPEKRFLVLSLLGGGLGVLAGFFLFRHKTKHARLVLGVFALTILFYASIIVLFLLL
jgi:uncharacterized membrane protein YsdA (DUF1294 family)